MPTSFPISKVTVRDSNDGFRGMNIFASSDIVFVTKKGVVGVVSKDLQTLKAQLYLEGMYSSSTPRDMIKVAMTYKRR